MDEQTESKNYIRNSEKDLVAKIKQNPHKWSSKSMKFEMTTETSSTPSVGVKLVKNYDAADHKFILNGPFHSDGNEWQWKNLGKIRMYKNFKLSLEWKMNSYPGNYEFFKIGNWFILSTRQATNGTGYILGLQQRNGLFNDGYLHDTNQEPFSIQMGQWNKEF